MPKFWARKLLPVKLRENKKVASSATLIIRIDLIIMLSSVLLAPVFHYTGFSGGTYLAIYSFINSCLFFGLMHLTKNLTLCGNFFALQSYIVFNGMVYFSGGLNSPLLIWMITIPPIAILYMRKKYAYFWGGMIVIAVAAFFLIDILNLSIPHQINGQYRSVVILFSNLLVIWLCITVVRSFKLSFRKMNARLLESNSDLQKSNAELERFAYIASHDLKSPLRNVVSFISLFQRRYGDQLEKNGQEYLDIAASNARQMHRLIEDILEFSKFNQQNPELQPVSIRPLVRKLKRQFAQGGEYPKALIECGPLPILMADPTHMQQLFQNLIENGIKYNDSDVPRVVVESEVEGENIVIRIADNGIGVPEEFRQQIFEMFKRLHTQEVYTGTGIGLAICRKVIRTYKGKIEVESREEGGSEFIVSLPIAMLPAEAITPSKTKKPVELSHSI